MIPKVIIIMLLCLFVAGTPAWPGEEDTPAVPAGLSPEELKIVAELETLQLWELAEEQEMMEDMNLLIEDDQNEFKTKQTVDSGTAGRSDFHRLGR